MSISVGIDLGTTFSAVAYIDPKTKLPQIIPNSEGSKLTPSVIQFLDGDVIFGSEAEDAYNAGEEDCVATFKREMGVDKPYCYMPLGMVDEIVRQCKELNIASFWLGSFTEGLLHPDILYIIRKCGEVHALDYWFTTNGTLLTEDIARAMIESGVTKLHVSLDAATPETYKKIRGGNLEIVEKNVRRFLQIRNEMSSELPMLRVTMVEQDENRGEIDAFVNKWTGVADIVDVQKLTDYSILQNDELDRESYKHTFFDCYYPFYQLSVTYDGRIWPCPCPVFNSGHPVYLKDMTLKEYWNSKEILDIVHAIKNNEDYYDCCLKCLSLKPKR